MNYLSHIIVIKKTEQLVLRLASSLENLVCRTSAFCLENSDHSFNGATRKKTSPVFSGLIVTFSFPLKGNANRD